MKRKAVVIINAFCFFCLLTACSYSTESISSKVSERETHVQYELTEKTITEINENSDFGAYLLFETIADKLREEEITTKRYYLNDESQDFAIAGHYPYSEDTLKLIHFYLFSNRQNVLGISIGQQEAEAREILNNYGFQQQELKGVFAGYSKDRYRCLAYTKNDVWIILKFDGKGIEINNIFLNIYDPATPTLNGAE